ncbi:hypothetical protein ARMGADRAFT_951467 [Armillaria gallica]|uniref:C3H1-type domain-containing protein n=1 Tax=Armillaria gallica TaxID=47427 RepID=A0A2H3CIK5_ARMGA|nr:hypothetical protein ARMGADRAFT_951467 [Armillaria gallica]
MLDNYENEQRVLHQEGANQLQARVRNEAEERRPSRPRAADFHEEEDEGEEGEGGDTGSRREEGSDDEGPDDDERGPAKRPRIDESQFPWQPIREISRAILHPELQLTLELVENYTLDLKAARRSLTNSPECPEFPDEQWLALLAGKAVNLDSVFAADHSTSINEVQTHEISEGIAIRLSENMSNPSESKRVISNADEWTTTWYTYSQAVLVAFPHRSRELALYQQYMSSLFRTTALPLHCRVFILDRAIRNRVGRCRNILLLDTDKFRDLERSHISPAGMAYQEFEERRAVPKSKRGNGDRGRNLDACRRWNAGVCPSTAGKCRYQHVCSGCKGGHPVSACPSRV